MKPTLLLRGPVETQSGYGSHARDIVQCLYELDMFDVMIDSCPWGMTPMTALEDNEFHNWIKSRIVRSIEKEPDVYVQVTVPNEFERVGKYNIGITAGIETTLIPQDWIKGCNKMDLIITTSKFSKDVMMGTIYNKSEKIFKPIKVLFEGVNTNIFNNTYKNFELDIPEDFCFLFVGSWLQGDLGQDRKNIGMMIRCFAEGFKDSKKKPALILKTNTGTFSEIQLARLQTQIKNITNDIENCPSIYLIYGELTDQEMNELYNHPKVKSMVSITRGEGFGRPLLEFTMTGKPIIASNWSGHVDFLDIDRAMMVGGKLEDVHPSAVNQFIIQGSKWFTANYDEFIGMMKYCIENYDDVKSRSESLRIENKEKFSMEKMKEELKNLLNDNKLRYHSL